MKITVTASTLCDLLGGHFTYEACEAICEFMDECGNDSAPSIGDIAITFAEIPQSWNEHDEDNTVALLDNGNVVVFR